MKSEKSILLAVQWSRFSACKKAFCNDFGPLFWNTWIIFIYI